MLTHRKSVILQKLLIFVFVNELRRRKIMIENKLFELQKACNKYKDTDPLADWVLYAVQRYIFTGRATVQFERNFINFPSKKFPELIKKCLNGDKSDDGIIKTARSIIG